MSGQSTLAYIGIGSNVGDRAAHLREAVAALARRLEVAAVSPAYETEAWGFTDQPAFLNAAVAVRAPLSPLGLLRVLKQVEQEVGRTPTFRWGPREIDLDLLLFGADRFESPELTVPHPRMHERAFVLIPLAEIAPEAVHPVLGKTVAALAREVEGRSGVRVWGKLDGGPPGRA